MYLSRSTKILKIRTTNHEQSALSLKSFPLWNKYKEVNLLDSTILIFKDQLQPISFPLAQANEASSSESRRFTPEVLEWQWKA